MGLISGFLRLFGFLAVWKWIGNKSKWKSPENVTIIQESSKKAIIENDLNKWLGTWKQILKWYRFLKPVQIIFCLLACITIPVGICLSSAWGYGIFGFWTFLTYVTYYKYFQHSRRLLKYQPKEKESTNLKNCKAGTRAALFFNFFPFLVLLGYKPNFDHLNSFLIGLVDTEDLFVMNPVLFDEKIKKLNKKPEELNGYTVNLEEFQQSINGF
ncbi:hypothetical protein DNK47_03255 [Mycoplasma wenyonii]|uniref:Uncharacterized protein n=1 Tax=Mycoplasma wenyonii TaxID=65123 RepID=A0A328PR13_9MOLU|nr:hypothetical protein [Mycoplasma wenyonii]RAO94767.1 hypothetical protein DNK47_03255 [Mycoplasma wenyonii]